MSDSTATPPEAVESGGVVGLIAMCDWAELQPSSPREYRFEVREMALLDNGDLVVLRDDLGWTIGFVGSEGPPELQGVLTTVGHVVLPDEDSHNPEPHPWEWLAQLAAARGISVTPQQLRDVPYRMYLSDRVIKLCAHLAEPGS